MAQQQQHPIFRDIQRGDLAVVQQRVLADPAVLEQRESIGRRTPLMEAIDCKQPAIAHWLLEHRGQHDVDTADCNRWTALHWASDHGPLQVVEALVAAGANPAALTAGSWTPLMLASDHGYTDTVAFLLQLPAVKATIDHSTQYLGTALSLASRDGHQRIVQLLLDAGADPTVPAGDDSPLYCALLNDHHAVAALLRHTIAEAERARALHKARSLLGAGAASLACLQVRVAQGQTPPMVELPSEQQQYQGKSKKAKMKKKKKERVRAAALFAAGVSGGEKDTGLCEDLYLKLQGYMLPAWADEGPEA